MPTPDDDRLVNLNARVPKRLWRALRLYALEQDLDLRVIITDALVDKMLEHRRPVARYRTTPAPRADHDRPTRNVGARSRSARRVEPPAAPAPPPAAEETQETAS